MSNDDRRVQPMRVLVTGATGVVGRRVVPMLVAVGHAVTAVGRTPEKRAALTRAGAHAIDVDLLSPEEVQHAVGRHEVVINLATHIPRSTGRMVLPGAWRENDRLRRDAAALLARASVAAGVGRFVQESFAPVYADGGDRWLDERAPQRPTRYNRTVLDAERAAQRVTEAGGTGIVLRFGGFYGPDAFHVHDMVRMLRAGWSPLPGAADAYWSSISHDDAATAVMAALDLPAGAYNVVDDQPLTRRAFADAVADAFALPRPRLLPGWTSRLMGSLGELLARSQRMSNAKLRGVSDWTPRIPSAVEGFRAVAAALSPEPHTVGAPRPTLTTGRG